MIQVEKGGKGKTYGRPGTPVKKKGGGGPIFGVTGGVRHWNDVIGGMNE